MLQQQFFLDKLKMNLSDMIIIIYSQKLTNDSLIIKKKVQLIMIRLFSDKMSEKTEIINNFLKTMRKFMIKMII